MKVEEFKRLKDEIETMLTITPDNIMSKSIALPKFYNTCLLHFITEKKALKILNNSLAKLYAKLYHHYKFEGNFKLDTKKEIETYVEGDDSYLEKKLEVQNLENVVEYLEQSLSLFNRVGFSIGHYIELLKIKNGMGE